MSKLQISGAKVSAAENYVGGTVTYTAPNRRGPTDPAFEAHMRIDFYGGTFTYCATDDGQTCVPPRTASVGFIFRPGDTITFLGLIKGQT